MQTKKLECYDFPEFCKQVQEAIEEGYSFDFESNERYPTSFGGYYNVELVKREAKTVEPSEAKEGTSETTSAEGEPKVAKRGRKAA